MNLWMFEFLDVSIYQRTTILNRTNIRNKKNNTTWQSNPTHILRVGNIIRVANLTNLKIWVGLEMSLNLIQPIYTTSWRGCQNVAYKLSLLNYESTSNLDPMVIRRQTHYKIYISWSFRGNYIMAASLDNSPIDLSSPTYSFFFSVDALSFIN